MRMDEKTGKDEVTSGEEEGLPGTNAKLFLHLWGLRCVRG